MNHHLRCERVQLMIIDDVIVSVICALLAETVTLYLIFTQLIISNLLLLISWNITNLNSNCSIFDNQRLVLLINRMFKSMCDTD